MARSRAQVFGRSTMPVFFTVTYAFVTSPMPWRMSMLVLQPRISTARDCTGVDVNVGVKVKVGVGVSVGVIGVLVSVGEGVSVFVRVTGTMTVTPGLAVAVKGKVIMIGVAVTMPGVREGGTVQTGNG